MNRLTILFFTALLVAISSTTAWSQSLFSSGAQGTQLAFPPSGITTAIGGGTSGTITVNLKTAEVMALDSTGKALTDCSNATLACVKLPGGASSGDAFATGELDFTTFTVASGFTLRFLQNTLNTPVTIRTTGDVTIAGTIDLRGGNGSAANSTGVSAAGRGAAGGFNGGPGGSTAVQGRDGTSGGPGLGRNAGAAGIYSPSSNAGGGNFPHANSNLFPLIGGAGGGGGRGARDDGRSGGGGGGGGGGILIASSTKISVTGTIDARGGDGGGNSNCGGCGTYAGGGGGGAGGGIRLISNQVQVSGGLNASGGGGGQNGGGAGGPGIIRVEATDITVTGTGVVPPANSGTPGVVRPLNLPRLRITSVGGVAVPDTPAGANGTVDVSVVPPVSNPMTIVVNATGVPDGTNITVSLKTTEGAETTAVAALTAGTTSVSMVVPTGVSFVQAFSATFTVTAELQRDLPLYRGEKILRASVEFDGEHERAYFFTQSGRRVSANDLFATQ